MREQIPRSWRGAAELDDGSCTNRRGDVYKPDAGQGVVPFEDLPVIDKNFTKELKKIDLSLDGKIAHLDADRKFVIGKSIKSKARMGQNDISSPSKSAPSTNLRPNPTKVGTTLIPTSTAPKSTGWLSAHTNPGTFFAK